MGARGRVRPAVVVVATLIGAVVVWGPYPAARTAGAPRPPVAPAPPPDRLSVELEERSTPLSTARPDVTAAGAVLAPPASPRRRALPADRACPALADAGFTARCGFAGTPEGDLLWLVQTRTEGRGFLVEVLRVGGADAEVVLEATDDTGARFERIGVASVDVSGDGTEEISISFYRRSAAQVLALDVVQAPGAVVLHREYVQGSARASVGRIEAWEAVRDRSTGKATLYHETIQFRDGGWSRTSLVPTPSAAVYGQDFPAPFLLRSGARYYAYSTNRGGSNVPLILSDDLRNWRPGGDALPQLPAWSARGRVWAPAVLARQGGYVLYYTTRHVASGLQCLSVAEAASPEGPFVDRSTGPLVCQTDVGGSIDPSPFVDQDGAAYLLWKSEDRRYDTPAEIWSQPLSPDGLSLAGSPTSLLVQDREWEKPTMEAPTMVRDGGRLYLLYSAGAWQDSTYAIGWATCSSPTGPCTKNGERPLVAATPALSGPGGQEVVQTADGRRWLAYHAWVPWEGGYPASRRLLHLSPLHFDAGGPVVGGLSGVTSPPDQ